MPQAVAERSYIFTGTVLASDSVMLIDSVALRINNSRPGVIREAMQTHFPTRSFRVALATQHKGATLADTVLVYSPAQNSACGSQLAEGRQYLFFADGKPEGWPLPANATLWTSACMRTQGYTEAAERHVVRLLRK